MIASALNDRRRAGIAHCKPFASDTTEIRFARNRAVQNSIAYDNIFKRIAFEVGVLLDDHASTAQALAHIIVGLARQVHRHAVRQKGGKALTGRAAQCDVNGVVRQARVPVSPGHFAGEHRACGTVQVADFRFYCYFLLRLQRRFCLPD